MLWLCELGCFSIVTLVPKSILAKQSHSPKIGHLRDSKSADAIGAQLAKLPHKAAKPQPKPLANARGSV